MAAPKAQRLMQRAAPTATNTLTLCDCDSGHGAGPSALFLMETPLQNCLGKSLHTGRPKGHRGHQGTFLILCDFRSDEGMVRKPSPLPSTFCMGRLGRKVGGTLWVSTLVHMAVDSFLLLLLVKAASSGRINRHSLLLFPGGTGSCLQSPVLPRCLL